MPPETVEEKLSNLTKYLLALLTGTVVLFPAVTAAFKPPYVFDWTLYFFWVTAILGIFFLGVAFYLSTFVRKTPPQRLAGLGTWLTASALFWLVIYVAANVISDRTSAPSIVSVLAEPPTAQLNQWVKLTATAIDEDEDALRWKWSITPAQDTFSLLDPRPVTYWKVPANAAAGEYRATVEVKDDRERTGTGNVLISIKGPQTNTQSDPEEFKSYIIDRIKLQCARILRTDPGKLSIVNSSTDTLVDSALRNLKSLDAVRDYPESLNDALDVYFNLPEPELQKAKYRPCCTKYPGIWPLCNGGC